jgi:hypothetical protein
VTSLREARPSLLWIGLLFLALYPIRCAAVYGASAQGISAAEDARLATLIVACACAVIALGIGFFSRLPPKTYHWSMSIAACWAILNLAVFENGMVRSIAGSLVVLLLCVGVGFFRSTFFGNDLTGASMKPALLLLCAMVAILPARPLERALSGYRLHQLLLAAQRDHSASALGDWISEATENRVLFHAEDLASAGRTLLAGERQGAWSAAVSILNARWATEEARAPDSPRIFKAGLFQVWGSLKVDVVNDSFVTHARGPGAVVLDGLYLKGVVFDRIPLAYKGGPLDLEAVELPHCSFDVTRSEAGKRFLEAALAPGALNFHSNP